MSTKQILVIAFISLFLIFFLLLPEQQTEQVFVEPIRPVRVAEVLLAPKEIKLRFSGTTQAVETFNVSFRVPGNVIEFAAQVGTPLKQGELIARLDKSDYITKLEQQQSALSREKVNADNAKSRFKRVEKLFKKGIVSAVDFENTQAEYLINKEKVSLATHNVELAQEQLNYTELRTTNEGCLLTEALVNEQENVTPSIIVAILSCGNLMEVQATVSESAVKQLSIGQNVSIAFNDIVKGKEVAAYISEIGVNSAVSGAYLVTAVIAETNNILRSGMAAELIITREFNVSDEQVWVPMIAIGEENNEKFVFVYNASDSQTGLIKKVIVKTDRHVKGMIEVTQGLVNGQQVVTAGLSQISDGLKVKLLSLRKGKAK